MYINEGKKSENINIIAAMFQGLIITRKARSLLQSQYDLNHN